MIELYFKALEEVFGAAFVVMSMSNTLIQKVFDEMLDINKQNNR